MKTARKRVALRDVTPTPPPGASKASSTPTAADAAGVKLRTEILHLSPSAISPDPDQPRQEFDSGSLARLAESLRTHGQLQPVLVRRDKGGYVLVAGGEVGGDSDGPGALVQGGRCSFGATY